MTSTTAITFTAPGRIALQNVTLQEMAATDVRVRTLYTQVSTGTELRVLAGHYGAKDRYPLIPGYSAVGRVEEVGAEVKGFRVGDLVTCRNPKAPVGWNAMWGGQVGMGIHTTLGEDRPVLLPDGADPLTYLIAEVSAISWRGVEAAAPRAGETAIVLGQGLIGAFAAAWLNARGCRVIVCDLSPGRLERAKRWSAHQVRIGDGDHEARLADLTCGGADIVVEGSGTAAGALMAPRLLRRKPQKYSKEWVVEPIHLYHQDWPRLVLQANYIEQITIDPFTYVRGEGMTVLAPMDRGIEDRQRVVEQLRRGTIAWSDFVPPPVPVAQAPQAYLALRDDPHRNLALAFDWSAV